jgi:predicted enzyme related to lactoylglutathione lyase
MRIFMLALLISCICVSIQASVIGDETEGTSEGEETMNLADQDRRINYIEFLTIDMDATKKFYSELFGWEFTDYGPDYSSFTDGQLFGGFVMAEEVKTVSHPLIVLFSTDLEGIRDKVVESGGKVVRDIFEFPGGRRFHFTDPSGNELAIWAE